jgi:hypothetical protein
VPPVDLRELIEDQAHDDPRNAGETQRVEDGHRRVVRRATGNANGLEPDEEFPRLEAARLLEIVEGKT